METTQIDDEETRRFDEIIGALEDVLVDPAFISLQSAFLHQHCHEFPSQSSTSENSFHQTVRHQEYCSLIEGAIEQHLHSQIPNFSVAELSNLIRRFETQQLSTDDPTNESAESSQYNEVIDLLLTITDFQHFKQLMQETQEESRISQSKRSAPSSAKAALDGFGLTITSLKTGQTKKF